MVDSGKTVIVTYGMGNLGSVKNMLKKIGCEAVITADPGKIESADRLILPGVGSFDRGMKNIKESGFLEILGQKVLEERTPILGICLGMQLLTEGSEEGITRGLGWISAKTVRFSFNGSPLPLKIPHMGWNFVRPARKSRLIDNIGDRPRFYFVHSYHVVCNNPDDIVLICNYGGEFACAVQHNNIMGVQFHPEKSHRFGLQLLRNFSEM
ncbi:MAG: imidazole glycerol phosphate synthase subunit HisH [Candidatus Zixiibacteriota bacterium]|nr:MAG: imidazole glycerol phosphate synthase subunit HisH [candidate division Zixibacteria bacterium]